jgi:hypothetical protein
MKDPDYHRNYFKQRYATDPEFRAHKLELSSRYIRDRCANDPEFRARRVRCSRNSRFKKQHGITLGEFEAQLAAQRGGCVCCGEKLGRVKRVHRKRDGAIGLLCSACHQRVASLAHVRQHAEAFEAYFKERGMTVQLGRFYEVMARCGWRPAQKRVGGRPT